MSKTTKFSLVLFHGAGMPSERELVGTWEFDGEPGMDEVAKRLRAHYAAMQIGRVARLSDWGYTQFYVYDQSGRQVAELKQRSW